MIKNTSDMFNDDEPSLIPMDQNRKTAYSKMLSPSKNHFLNNDIPSVPPNNNGDYKTNYNKLKTKAFKIQCKLIEESQESKISNTKLNHNVPNNSPQTSRGIMYQASNKQAHEVICLKKLLEKRRTTSGK